MNLLEYNSLFFISVGDGCKLAHGYGDGFVIVYVFFKKVGPVSLLFSPDIAIKNEQKQTKTLFYWKRRRD